MSDAVPISRQLGSSYHLIRIAALSGAAAVCLAAYGRHSLKETDENKDYRQIYENANNMHLVHSVALLATPLTKRPLIVTLQSLIPSQHTYDFNKFISDWNTFHNRNAVIQRYLLLQSNKEIER